MIRTGPSRTATRRSRRLAGVVAVLACLLAAVPDPAAAHAVLRSSEPADGTVTASPPDEIRLRFSEPVSAPAGGIRVFDSSGERIDEGRIAQTEDGTEASIGLPDELDDGTYIVTWRATSADGHPVKGAFLFSVGAAGGVSDTLVSDLFAADADRPWAIAATVVRWLMYLGSLIALGAAAFLALTPSDRERFGQHGAQGVHDPRSERELQRRWAWRVALVGVGATFLGLPLQAAQATGLGFQALTDLDVLGDTAAAGGFGLAAGLRLLGLGLLAAGFRGGDRGGFRPLAGGGAALLLTSFLVTGHTVTTEPTWLVVGADAVHVAAAALWSGGLAMLALALRHRRFVDDPIGAADLVARFSTVATAAIAGVTVAGAALAWAEVRALRALTSTTYGWTLVVKLALAAGVIALGAYNHLRLTPLIARAAERPVGDAEPAVPAGGADDELPRGVDARSPTSAEAWSSLRRTVQLEVIGIVAVLGVTALLVYQQPAREAAGITGAYSTYARLDPQHEINLVVDPNRAGRNEIHLYLLDETGRPAQADQLQLRLSMPANDIGPIERTPTVAGPGHWLHTGPELSIPGTWEIEVVVATSRFDQDRLTLPVTVNR